MPKYQMDHLFNLVKSLTKAEKRNFKLYVNRIQGADDSLFVQLFDLLDKSEEFHTRTFMEKLNISKKNQFANLKRHLYNQILTSLSLIHRTKKISLKIREKLNHADILYAKGLYMQSLKILERALQLADDVNQDALHLEILQMIRLIEEKHITRSRSIDNKIENLLEQTDRQIHILKNRSALSILKIKIHGLYIQYGHAKDKDQASKVMDYFNANFPQLEGHEMGFFEKVYIDQAYVWLYYIILDFENCLHHSANWVKSFHQSPDMIGVNPDLFLRGLHYKVTSLFHLKKVSDYEKTLRDFQQFERAYAANLSVTSKIIYFLYYHYAVLDYFSLIGDYDQAVKWIPKIGKSLKKFEHQMDSHRKLTFFYRFAWIYFARKDYNSCVEYLLDIINLKAGHLREDIQGYAWLLYILCHWEQKHFVLLPHLIETAARVITKMKVKNSLQVCLMKFIRSQLKEGAYPSKDVLLDLRKDLVKIQEAPYERKSFLYLDAIKWIDSKLKNVSIGEITKSQLSEGPDKIDL